MAEHFRALLFILLLSTAFFAFAGRPASMVIGRGNFRLRRNLWFGLTLVAFLAHSFWAYTFAAIPMLIYANRKETNPPALYFFILFALPVAYIQIPAMGLVNYLFELSHARILELLILLPAFFILIRQSGTLPLGKTGSDKALVAYLLLTVILYLRGATLTETFRLTFSLFIDVFLPYFVISRSLKDPQAFRDALLSLVLAIMILALIAVFEANKQWLLYRSVIDTLELGQGKTGYLTRDGMLRASASAGQPIALGYLMVVGMGFYLFLQRSFQQKLIYRLGMALLAAGLIAPLSRGPWVGAAVLLVVFIVTGPNPTRRLMGLALAGILALPLLAALPGAERIINLLPFIGTTEKNNIDFRQDLITSSMRVIQHNPWFGSVNYLASPELDSLRINGDFIDITNTYIFIALEQGFVGLGLFVGFFALVVTGVYRAMRLTSDRTSEEHLLGRVLLSTLVATLVIIFTVSNITVIPIVYWSVAGLGVAYAQMIRKQADSQFQLAVKSE